LSIVANLITPAILIITFVHVFTTYSVSRDRKSNSAGAFVTTDDISTLMLALMSPGRALVDISTAFAVDFELEAITALANCLTTVF